MTPQDYNQRFLERLLKRRPQDRARYEAMLSTPVAEGVSGLEAMDIGGSNGRDFSLETIVRQERPVLFVRNGRLDFDPENVTILGPEAEDLARQLQAAENHVIPLLPLVGRFDVTNLSIPFVGTGWFVDTDIVVTNRHVASLIAQWDGRHFVFRRGVAAKAIEASVCTAHEFDDQAPDSSRIFKIKEVLYIEPDSGPFDIAFVRVERRTTGSAKPYISISESDISSDQPVCSIGYPAKAPRNLVPDQALMEDLFKGRYDVKRAAPGYGMGTSGGTSEHDCTTLGGNSGSVVINLKGESVGLHFAGLYKQANYAVPASVLRDYVSRKRWNQPVVIESSKPQVTHPAPPAIASPPQVPNAVAFSSNNSFAEVTIPITIRVSVGTPVASGTVGSTVTPRPPIGVAQVQDSLLAYWRSHPKDVLAARVGYLNDQERIGDQPCIAASVRPSEWKRIESQGPHEFQGVPVRYLPADVDEQIAALPQVESVNSIAYDDDARTSEKYSFDLVDEEMDLTLHVGPEYSWDVLREFLEGTQNRLVSSMYEFHAKHIQEVIVERLRDGVSLKLVLDNATFSTVKNEEEEFDRVEVFKKWAQDFHFERIVAPEGTSGLISDSYHIKVTVRDGDAFWLSSGNWKMGSSQPPITQEQRDNAANKDLPGNREWHVVVRNKTLSDRFRSHILQDFKRSADLGGVPVPARVVEEAFIDVPVQESVVLERRAPSRILEPLKISKRVKVQPLLTPDQEGAVFSEAVLKLIRSARRSLLFQIPYIGMPSNPEEDRGYVDELIGALIKKLKSLPDARVILRTGGQKLSSPSHAAWYFKSQGVDIDQRLRVIDNHHTKGMIVDGRRVLIGSHNWSKPGVTLNRDASLIFHDEEVAGYYAQAFEIDWERANPIRPRQFVRNESVVFDATGAAPPAGYHRVRLSEWISDD